MDNKRTGNKSNLTEKARKKHSAIAAVVGVSGLTTSAVSNLAQMGLVGKAHHHLREAEEAERKKRMLSIKTNLTHNLGELHTQKIEELRREAKGIKASLDKHMMGAAKAMKHAHWAKKIKYGALAAGAGGMAYYNYLNPDTPNK